MFVFAIWLLFWGSRGRPEAASKTVPNKTPKYQRWQSVLGSYFGPFWVPNLIFVDFVCDNFYAYFWHRFWEAFGSNFRDLGVISGSILKPF